MLLKTCTLHRMLQLNSQSLPLLSAGDRSRVGPSDGRKEEAQPHVVGQPARGAGVRRKRENLHSQGTLMFGSAPPCPDERPTSDRGGQRSRAF